MDKGCDTWNMCVMLWIDAEESLSKLREEIIARTGLQVEARTFRPHISLLYGVLDFDKREEIARALNERFFDESEDLSFKLHKVALVESPVPGYDGIGDWKVVSEIDIQ
mmetsp:Transcript_14561/g.49703  ORF Transcript_14561/g.49703 Transcript_14561/m.49703 type:complete len:109 (-) Transcript_14561:23-349(-)